MGWGAFLREKIMYVILIKSEGEVDYSTPFFQIYDINL